MGGILFQLRGSQAPGFLSHCAAWPLLRSQPGPQHAKSCDNSTHPHKISSNASLTSKEEEGAHCHAVPCECKGCHGPNKFGDHCFSPFVAKYCISWGRAQSRNIIPVIQHATDSAWILFKCSQCHFFYCVQNEEILQEILTFFQQPKMTLQVSQKTEPQTDFKICLCQTTLPEHCTL